MLHNYNRTLPSRDKLKRLTDYSEAIQKQVKTLAIQHKIDFYIVLERNGQFHKLHARDIEHIHNSDPQKATVIIEHHPSGISPFQYCGWKQVWVDDDIVQSLIKNKTITQHSAKSELEETEKKTLLKMLLGMAIDSYGYKVASSRQSATGNNKDGIRAALQSLNLDVTDDTIRKYLNEATELFSDLLPK